MRVGHDISQDIPFYVNLVSDGSAMTESPETIYERVERLEDEVAVLRTEVDRLKHALRGKIARHEISLIKSGQDVRSIID